VLAPPGRPGVRTLARPSEHGENDPVTDVPVADSPDGIRVLIVDDQAPFRRAARAVVLATPGFEVVGEAESGEDAVTLAEDLGPALVLMDINLPGINGIEATRRITAAHPDVVTVLLSTYREEDLPPGAKECGAVAYVNKEEFGPGVLIAHRPDGH
jgi:two-component system invasion response regulator UvrY